MKKILFILLLSFCTLLLFACQSQEKEMMMLDDISSISISKSGGYGGINENYIATIDKDTTISRFEEALKNAEGREQKVNVDTEKPDYDILIRYENGELTDCTLCLGIQEKKAE
ncbi:hypothetical protein [Paracerasibacillus soli]|uniref:Lipoprotein n=1 Tax=Paracerasibacillus soli TaxID=480284 RepID=A0ABU5CTE5_9BACI|nr:hypothetical protein [Virgibacillus soli]MDY0408683.1 hypothetical protein [Virgibacillus soli]